MFARFMVVTRHVSPGYAKQTAMVDHADMRGLVATGLYYVAELAFL